MIIGIEIAVMFPDPTSSAPIWLACITNGISVGIGELISCTVLGVVLVKLIESNAALRKILRRNNARRFPMQPNGMIFWDWNGTLMDDVGFYPRNA